MPSTSPVVLHVVWNLIRGGTEGQCARVAMQLAGNGGQHRVAVFRREGFFLDPVEATCGAVHHVDIRSAKSPRTLLELHRLKRFILKERIDVVHCWDADAVIFGSLAARWAGVPFITSRRDLGEIYPEWKLRRMAEADRRASAVVVNAHAIKEQWAHAARPPAKIVCISNVLDVEEFDALSKESFLELPEGRWIGVVARLDPEKDVDTVIRAAALLRQTHPDVRLAVAGDGKERARLEALAAECGTGESVRFLGDITSVPAFLKRCCVGLLTPKANEGLSNTILEYMAAALPTVATDCGGNGELVKNGETGYLAPVGDEAHVAAAIRNLLDHPERAAAYGKRAREVIGRHHRPEQVARQFEALYEGIVLGH